MSKSLDRHPLSSKFPDMDKEEFAQLVEDIREHGLRNPIITFGGSVLDGWHRYQACQEAEVKPRFEELPKDVSPADYVLSHNAYRRHMSKTQMAAAIIMVGSWQAPGEATKDIAKNVMSRTATEIAEEADVSKRLVNEVRQYVKEGHGEDLLNKKETLHSLRKKKNPPPEKKGPTKMEKLKTENTELSERVAELEKAVDNQIPKTPSELEEENAKLRRRITSLVDDLAKAKKEVAYWRKKAGE